MNRKEAEDLGIVRNADYIVAGGGPSRKPLDSYEERNKMKYEIYPQLEEDDETVEYPTDMNEDTHSVHNGEDEEVMNDQSDIFQQRYAENLCNSNERKTDKRRSITPIREKSPAPKRTRSPAYKSAGFKTLSFPLKDSIHPELGTPQMHGTVSTPASTNRSNPKSFPFSFWKVIFPILILILGALASLVDLNPVKTPPAKSMDFNSILSNLTHSFEGQPDMSFRIVRSALKAVSAPEPQAPAIILLLASKGAEKLALNLGNALVSSVSSSPIAISGSYYRTQKTDVGKKQIDEALRVMDATADSEFNAVLIKDLHLIPGETALMLHTYCDSENAPYKRVVYVLTVNMDEEVAKSRMKDWDVAVNKRLDRAWNDVDEDQRAPLLSRLTVSVAGIFVNH